MTTKTKPSADLPRVKPGDWVCFHRGGVLVIGAVAYVTNIPYRTNYNIFTSAGSTSSDAILEVRRGS